MSGVVNGSGWGISGGGAKRGQDKRRRRWWAWTEATNESHDVLSVFVCENPVRLVVEVDSR